jgi:cytochrome c oxidase subunit 3
MTLAIRSAKLGDRGGLYRNLLITAALAAGFLVLKGFEYNQDYEESYVPGVMFQREYAAAEKELADAEKKANAERIGKTAADKNSPADYKPLTHDEVEKFQFSAERQKWSADMAKHNHGKIDTDAGFISPHRVQLFLCFYYIMTGIHGIHILAGIGCILWLVLETYRGTIPPENYSTVEVVSLYWHLVDGIWLFLMPLLYLAGAGMHH